MTALLATIRKELLELRRDRAGLLVLLVMPAALMLTLSLVQDNILRASGDTAIRVLFVDDDHGFLGREIERRLRNGGLDPVRNPGGRVITAEEARRAVAQGEYPFLILIPQGTGTALRKRIRERTSDALRTGADPGTPPASPAPGLVLRFDPAVQGSFRTAVVQALRFALLGIELEEQGAALSEEFPVRMQRLLGRFGALPPGAVAGNGVPRFGFRLETEPILSLEEKPASTGRVAKRPTAAQQNVPAWSLFGMFFVVVPISGALIRERQTGTLRRLMTTPVPPALLLMGKTAAYTLVCMVQFAVMLGIGAFVLPRIGTSGLLLGPAAPAVAGIALAASLAASGYGIMVGTLARSYEQASMFGAVSVVIAAAIGGIMVPVYVMPRFLQDASPASPLAWGLNAFLDVLVREGTLRTVLPEITYLFLFSLATISVAWWSLCRTRSQG